MFFERLSEFGNVDGVEPCEQLINPSGRYSQRIHIGPFDETFHPGKRYSLILLLDVLEHIEDPVTALRHVADLLFPNGTFIATVPAFMALWTNHDDLNHHFARYVKPSFRAIIEQAGLQICEERYLYHWTFPVKLGVRAVERAFLIKPKPAAVPPPPLNEMLYLISRLEQKTLSVLPIPFGSSLFVVGRKGPS